MNSCLQIVSIIEYYNFRFLTYILPMLILFSFIENDRYEYTVGEVLLITTIVFESGSYHLYYVYTYEKHEIIYYLNILVFILANIEKLIFSTYVISKNKFNDENNKFLFILSFSVLTQCLVTLMTTAFLISYFNASCFFKDRKEELDDEKKDYMINKCIMENIKLENLSVYNTLV